MPKENISENAVRLKHLETIKQAGHNPYPATAGREQTLAEAKSSPIKTAVKVAGRIIFKREMGKLCFIHLKDASAVLQAAFSDKELGADEYKFFIKNFDLGDFIRVEGEMFITHKGEITILTKKYALLAKALLPLPEKWHGLQDVEIRYRQRYLDLIVNDESMRIAKMRSALVKEVRRYLDAQGFFEVETPILQPLYGGANARPFITHHNALNIDLYLRVAPELYLKRLIAGGFEKVYEVAKCFRNEGIDNNHNPEFTQVEFYWAYADYNDLMDLMEDLLPKLIKALGLKNKMELNGQTTNFTPPYERITMRNLLIKYAKLDIENFPDQKSLLAKAKTLGVKNANKTMGRGKLIDEIYKTLARPKIIDPIFMIEHPVELSPLAKAKTDNPRYAERMQLICAGGNELCNAFSELNDPLDQENRFREQEKLGVKGDEESMPYDEDFVLALKYGLPPTAGLGMGIDRLVKLLAGVSNLKEAILFPTLKPEKK